MFKLKSGYSNMILSFLQAGEKTNTSNKKQHERIY